MKIFCTVILFINCAFCLVSSPLNVPTQYFISFLLLVCKLCKVLSHNRSLLICVPAPGDKKHKKYERQIAIPTIVHENCGISSPRKFFIVIGLNFKNDIFATKSTVFFSSAHRLSLSRPETWMKIYIIQGVTKKMLHSDLVLQASSAA